MIYILDTGFGDLELEYKNPNIDYEIKTDHGHMIYTIAKCINPDTPISVYEVGGTPSNQDIIDALEMIERISDGGVIAMSLTVNKAPELEEVVRRMQGKFHFIVAGGNHAKDITTLTPAGMPEVVTVGSLNKNNEIASHNSVGHIDIFAPGTNIHVEDVKKSGTSVAMAIVAGFWSKYYNIEEVRQVVQNEFDKLINFNFSLLKKYAQSSAEGGVTPYQEHAINSIDKVSNSFCLAKWLQVTLHLQNGRTHSCHHPKTHHVPIEELRDNPSALHNTKFKKEQRKMMLEGERPAECQYCWNVEDLPGNHLSDRYNKSMDTEWAFPHLEEVVEKKWDDNINPTYVEVSFSNVCNFKCSYCSPVHSSQWVHEVEKKGPFHLTGRTHNGLEWYKQNNEMPIHHTEHNPYVEAFWEWWPELVQTLKVFRITGGEPLLDKNTFKVLEYLNENPHPNLEVDINSNLCITDARIDKYIGLMKTLLTEGKIKGSKLYASVDGTGKQAEYGREGLDYEQWYQNIDKVLTELPELKITVMCTTNIFSSTTMEELMSDMLVLKEKHMNAVRRVPISVDTNMLRWPAHQSLAVLPAECTNLMDNALEFMKNNMQGQQREKYKGFYDFEIARYERVLEYAKNPPHKDEGIHLPTAYSDFYLFVNQHDERRGTNFLETFPELEGFYRMCEKESNNRII